MLSRQEIKEIARARVRENRGQAIGGFVVAALVIAAATAASGITVGVGAFLLVPVLEVGYNFFCTAFYQGGKPDIGSIFNNAFENYGRKVGGMLWMMLFTVLWSMLFAIPGIVKALSYSMTPYILANEPEVEAQEALKISMRMTDGHKWEIFVFELSFLGWQLLSALTCGILEIVFVGPYSATSMAGYYLELKKNAIAEGRVFESEFNGVKLV